MVYYSQNWFKEDVLEAERLLNEVNQTYFLMIMIENAPLSVLNIQEI